MGKEQEVAENSAETVDETAVELSGEDLSTGPDGSENVTTNPEDLHLMLEDARNKADEHWNQLLRAKAEFENLQRRHERDLQNAHKFALEGFASDILSVRDSMELGLDAANNEAAEVKNLREGSELTLKLLSDVMERYKIVQIDPNGEPFNPDYHQAMSMQPREDVPPNTVVAVMQKGYTLNDRLIRPAMVMVSQGMPGKVDEQA
ncbi:MAG: nucleotide exchange factor GrpE [Gammaproteobacteria bacterium]|nr:nucleotide exchange factor GrpE [Gammaproteobacteria bacterium]